ncbi:MAG TPA: dihydroorotate dehydrogenase (quinone), partial [Acidimicrobiia bacterium]
GFLGPAMRKTLSVTDSALETSVAGVNFPTPIGLAAGFDKNGRAIRTMAGIGFGFVEIGSVSLSWSPGNSRPRLFRLPDDRSVIVAYGVPNEGAEAVSSRLSRTEFSVPVGINIVKTNGGPGSPPGSDEAIVAEYVEATRALQRHADYLMFNLSCPNTADGKDFFSDASRLDMWLSAMAAEKTVRPIFLKVSPLGGVPAVERLLASLEPYDFVDGIMFNLPIVKPEGEIVTPRAVWSDLPGAVSGPPSAAMLDSCLAACYRMMDKNRYRLFASGGVSTGANAYQKIRLGASLVSLHTALIYEGPLVVRRVTRQLSQLLARDGIAHIADVVGADNS